MSKVVDRKIQDAQNLEPVANKYQSQIATAGISTEYMTEYHTKLEDAIAKDVAQKESMENKKSATRLQDSVLKRCYAALKKVLNIAKSAYVDDRDRLKEFHIGGKLVRGVGATLAELAYMKNAVTDHMDELGQWGANEALLTEIDTCIRELTDADNSQENAKNLQVVATNERDRAVDMLEKAKYRIRKAAEIVFADNADMLKEFESTVF